MSTLSDTPLQNRPDADENVFSMAEIYSNTSQGLIWLGESDESTEKALQSINAAYAEAYAETNEFRDLRATLKDTFRLLKPLGFAPDFPGLARLVGRPWFSRRWVIQEALLASSSRCIVGEFEVGLREVLQGTVWIMYKSYWLPPATSFFGAAQRVLAIWNLEEEKQSGGRVSLSFILRTSRGSKVRDERDMVFALLGLSLKLQRQTKLHPLLAPDYSKSPEAVVCDANRYMVAVEKYLSHLHFPHHQHKSDPLGKKLPSWAITWHRERDLTCDPLPFLRRFNADGPDPKRHFRPPSEISGRILSVRGKMVERVRAVTEVIDLDITPGQIVAILGWFEVVWSSLTMQASEQSSSSRLGEVLIAGSDHNGDQVTEEFSVGGYLEWLKYLQCEGRWPDAGRRMDESEAATLRQVLEYNRAFWCACSNRVLFITECGRMGVGPQTLKEDDLVAVLYRCRYPSILRHFPDSDQHEFIGIAYIDGLMSGEAVEDAEQRGIEDITFHLR